LYQEGIGAVISMRARSLPCVRLALACASFVWILVSSSSAEDALSPSAQRGLNFVRANCARCHAIDKLSPSPLSIAPPFRTLHERYPVENLEEALGEGIVTGHPSMPEFQLDPGQVGDVIAFLKTLER
jgi:mono/diheme cytochrome c family protein